MKRWWVAIVLAVLVAGSVQGAVSAAPAAQGAFPKGSVAALKGTPHLWVADEQSVLHWVGDTRALAGHDIKWDLRSDVSLSQLKALPIGDPWLSAGLLKDGDAIYLVKWEAAAAAPTLQHIQSIADVKLFGIGDKNYGQYVLDRAEWERRFSMSAAALPRAELTSAAALVDTFDDASTGLLVAKTSSQVSLAYQGGEYVMKALAAGAWPIGRTKRTFGDASIAIDARLVGDTDQRLISLGCREDDDGQDYELWLYPQDGLFALVRLDKAGVTELAKASPSPVIKTGTQTNRLELSCVGSTIAARINGTLVATAQDSSFTSGDMYVALLPAGGQTAEAHFDNLVITEQ